MGLSHSPSIVTNGLVLCLDAGNTKSYPGSGTTWTDRSGRGNNGTLVNGPTYSSSNGGSIVFDGVNDYASTTFSFSSRPLSINCWVYFNSLSGWQTFVCQDTSQSTALGMVYFGKVNNNPSDSGGRSINTFGMSLVTTSSTEVYCYDTTAVTTGVWYNYSISVSTTDMNLYRNGLLVKTITNSDSIATPTGTTVIGNGYYNNALVDFANARIAQVSIYNRALTAAEVQQNFNALRGRFGI